MSWQAVCYDCLPTLSLFTSGCASGALYLGDKEVLLLDRAVLSAHEHRCNEVEHELALDRWTDVEGAVVAVGSET